MIQKFMMPDGTLQESATRDQAEKLVAAGGRRVPSSTFVADPLAKLQPMQPDDNHDPNASTVTVDNLLQMTVNAQLSQLPTLSDEKLSQLQEQETRKRALDNIGDELERRTAPNGSS